MHDVYLRVTEDHDSRYLWIQRDDFINPEDYLECLVFLLTVPMIHLCGRDGKRVAGVANPCCIFEYYIPLDVSDRVEPNYWDNYTWICKTLLGPETCAYQFGEIWMHFKMASDKEIKYPPIPKFLVDFWVQYKER